MNCRLVKEVLQSRNALLRAGILSNNRFLVAQDQQQRKFTQNFWQSVSASKPVEIIQESVTHLHDLSGLPWWATIIASTVILRSVMTFPLAIYQTKVLAKVEKLTEEMPALVKELKVETSYAIKKFNLTEVQARSLYNRSLKKQWNKLIIRDNCHPAKAMLVLWFQIPLWITQSWAIRNLLYMQPDPTLLQAQMVCADMMVGGFGWIPNLTEVDHSYILPVMLGILNLTIIEIQTMSKKSKKDTRFQKYATYFFRGLSVCMIPIAAFVPSGLCLYWVSSSAFGLMQNLVILSPKMKRLARIPKTPSELDQPYKFLMQSIRTRLKLKD